VRRGAAGALCPGIDLHEALREQEAVVQGAPPVVILDDPAPHIIDADARHPRRGALEIARLLAIELQEGANMLEHLGFGREPHELVGAAVFLCSPAADFITGQILAVDGGILAGSDWRKGT